MTTTFSVFQGTSPTLRARPRRRNRAIIETDDVVSATLYIEKPGGTLLTLVMTADTTKPNFWKYPLTTAHLDEDGTHQGRITFVTAAGETLTGLFTMNVRAVFGP